MAIYAVLIGINGYPVQPLSGCIQDIIAVEEYLTHFARQNNQQLFISKLTDQERLQPTRENFLKSFEFFEPAAAGDFCLFYYSGHGSFTLAPKEFWTESDGYNESFVCIDSRVGNGRDVADKEFSFLAWKTFKNKPEVTFLAFTDCCHSGTIVKAFENQSDLKSRMMSPSTASTLIEDYYGFGELVDGEPGYLISEDQQRVTVKQSKNIHFAASRDDQTSKELVIDGLNRGVFTYSLLKTLYKYDGLISYKDLIDHVSVLVGNIVSNQKPQLSLNGTWPGSEKEKLFLSQSHSAANPLYAVYYDAELGSWCIKAGRLNEVNPGDIVLVDGLCETAVTGAISADISTIKTKLELGSKDQIHAAAVKRLGMPAFSLSFSTDLDQALQTLLKTAAGNRKSMYFQLSDQTSQYFIHQSNGAVYLTFSDSNIPIFKPMQVNNETAANIFFQKVEAVSKWTQLKLLDNPATSFNSDTYQLTLYRNILPFNSELSNFEKIPIKAVNDYPYKRKDQDWGEPAFRLSISNNSPGPLWFCCTYLGVDYSLTQISEAITVGAGRTAWLTFNMNAVPTDVIPLHLQDKFMELGYQQITEYLKVFVSTDRIDLGTYDIEGIELAQQMQEIPEFEINSRGFGTQLLKTLPLNDWKTELIGFCISRPLQEVPLSTDQNTQINGLKIENPGKLEANVKLSSSSFVFKSAEKGIASALLRKSSNTAPYDLLFATGTGNVLDVLELTEVRNPKAVNAENPLIIVPDKTRSMTEERVIPIGFDTESGLYFPVGYTNNQGNIVVDTLPSQTGTDPLITDKSLFGSIKIYFQKVIGDTLGFGYDYPRLAVAAVSKSGELTYHDDKVADQVAAAENILLFIHGIIGDTEGMLKSIHFKRSDGSKLSDAFDLVMAFDYENLNTPLEDTAALLKSRLNEAGFKPGDHKRLTIVAHSMGGLLSRYFIEKLDGDQVVDHLVMLGTPNNGTPWADVRDMAEVLLTYAMNGAAFLKPWMFLLSGVGKLLNGVQNTLKQMDAESEFYRHLNTGTAPKIPYTIIAGNTRLIVPDFDKIATGIGKLFARIKTRGLYDSLDVLLFRKPNDIAVTDDSISLLEGAEDWLEHKPALHTVACDHLNYFVTKEALDLIR